MGTLTQEGGFRGLTPCRLLGVLNLCEVKSTIYLLLRHVRPDVPLFLGKCSTLGNETWHEPLEAQPTKQDGVWVMHNY